MTTAAGKTATAARAMAALALLALCACSRPDWTDPETSKGARSLPPPPAKAATPIKPGPPPAQPSWVRPLVGKPLRDVFPRDGVCVGNTDGVARLYQGAPGGGLVVGWAWEFATKAPVPRVVLVGASGTIVGGADTGSPRPDVPAAMPAVTSDRTGWEAVSSQTHGRVDAYGVIESGRAICALAGADF